MSARADANIKVWTPWRHIGRGSGELCIGRVCFDIHTEQPWRWFLFSRRKPIPNPQHPAHGFGAFAIAFATFLLIVRRWR